MLGNHRKGWVKSIIEARKVEENRKILTVKSKLSKEEIGKNWI